MAELFGMPGPPPAGTNTVLAPSSPTPTGTDTVLAGSVTSSSGETAPKGPSQEWQNKKYYQIEAPYVKDATRKIIGLHPSAYYEPGEGAEEGKIKKLAYAWSGVAHIWPCWPTFGDSATGQAGLQIFSLDRDAGAEKYKKVIENAGIVPSFDTRQDLPISVAFLNDIGIGESWSNTYGASKFEGMANMGSSTIQELRSITGAEDLGGIVRALTKGSSAGGVGEQAAGLTDQLQGGVTSMFGNNADAVMQLFAGSRVDFPTIWNGCSYSPSYQLTVRLYNPNPKDPAMYSKHILEPLCLLMGLVMPLSDSRYTYNYPVLVQVQCPGIFQVDAGYISDLQVIKGGENQDFTWQQQPGTVDVRFSINTLYNTMTATTDPEHEDDTETNSSRPTLKKYFNNLKDWMNYDYPFGEKNGTAESAEPIGLDISIPSLSTILPNEIFNNPLGRVLSDLTSLADSLTNGIASLENILGTDLSFIEDLDNILEGISNGQSDLFSPLDSLFGAVDNILDLFWESPVGEALDGFLDILALIGEILDAIVDAAVMIISLVGDITALLQTLEGEIIPDDGMTDAQIQAIVDSVAKSENSLTPSTQVTDNKMEELLGTLE